MSGILDQDFPDEEEDDFNPQPEIGSDEEADGVTPVKDRRSGNLSMANKSRSADEVKDEEDDSKIDDDADDDADDHRGSAKPNTNGDAKSDDDEARDEDEDQGAEEEDEEEEEDDDDDDDDVEGQPIRKRRRKRRNQFFDVEAEVDEDDEEEPEEEDDVVGEEVHPDDLQELDPGADKDDRMHRELDRARERQEALDVEETAAILKERYGRKGTTSGAGTAIVPQRLLLPGVGDPRIWRFKCKQGKEKEVMVAINQRMMERANSREPIRIISAFEREGTMSGSIYIEALRQDDITPAVADISNIFQSFKPILIPIEEMPDLLHVTKSKPVEPGMYVRMRKGVYKGDLALIDSIEGGGMDITVKLVPRLDYGLNEDANAAPAGLEDGPGGAKRKRAPKSASERPPPRLFSESEARKRHSKFLQSNSGLSKNSWIYQGKEYTDGFLIQTFTKSWVQTDNVNPTLEEVTKFVAGAEDGTENLDLAALAATLKQSTADSYLPGDHLELYRGEQKGVTGRAVEVYGEVVKIRVDAGALQGQVIEAPINDLRKLFREGDHVKIIGGSKYATEVGMVVRTKDDRVTILTDSNQQEVTVFSKDVREATDSGDAIGHNQYDLLDLVQLDAATVGCVVKVDRESLRVLDQFGSVRSLLPSNITNRIDRRKFGIVATDREGHEMKLDDSIKEFAGEQRSGHVLHLHRTFVFALNREMRENAGVWVARHNNVITVAAKGGRMNGGPDLSKMNPALKHNPGAGGGPMPPPQPKGRERLIGKSVKVRTGAHKGIIGIVKDSSTGNCVIVEMHAKNKKFIVDKDALAVVDPHTGKIIHQDARSFGMGRPPPNGPPHHNPMSGGQTPGRGYGPPPSAVSGGRTPAYAMAGGRTPAWKQDAGSRTPAHGDGGQTAYGGGFGGSTSYGGGTSYGGATSYGGGSVWGGGGYGGGGQSTWNPNTGGRTPAHNAGSKTPAYHGMEPTSPDFTSAPTPGNFLDHPTPGGFRGGQYQTPAAYNTPGGFPETPAPYSAETPAADDGPRYD